MKPVTDMTIMELCLEYFYCETEILDWDWDQRNTSRLDRAKSRKEEVMREAKRRDTLVAPKQDMIGV